MRIMQAMKVGNLALRLCPLRLDVHTGTARVARSALGGTSLVLDCIITRSSPPVPCRPTTRSSSCFPPRGDNGPSFGHTVSLKHCIRTVSAEISALHHRSTHTSPGVPSVPSLQQAAAGLPKLFRRSHSRYRTSPHGLSSSLPSGGAPRSSRLPDHPPSWYTRPR